MSGTFRERVLPTVIVWGDTVSPKAPRDVAGRDHSFTLSGWGNVVLSEEHDRSAMVTEHTVEQGSNIIDHIRPNPKTLKLEVFISNTPAVWNPDADFLPMTLDIPRAGQVNADGTPSFFAGGTGALIDKGLQALGLAAGQPPQRTYHVLQFNGETDYAQIALDKFTELQTTGTLLQVFTPKAAYDNMVLSSIMMHRSAGTGTSATFTLEFREIHIVESLTVDAPLPTVVTATPNNNQGKKDTKTADGPKTSLLNKSANGNGQLFAPAEGIASGLPGGV